MKRILWALRFSPVLMGSGLALCFVGGSMLFLGPPVVPAGFPAVPVVWAFGALPWHLSCLVGGLLVMWALYLDKDSLGSFL